MGEGGEAWGGLGVGMIKVLPSGSSGVHSTGAVGAGECLIVGSLGENVPTCSIRVSMV